MGQRGIKCVKNLKLVIISVVVDEDIWCIK